MILRCATSVSSERFANRINRNPAASAAGFLRVPAAHAPQRTASLGPLWKRSQLAAAHALYTKGAQCARLRAERYFLRRTRRRKTRFDPLPPSADGGTLRGSCSINRRNILYRQSERTPVWIPHGSSPSVSKNFDTLLKNASIFSRGCRPLRALASARTLAA